MYRTEYTFGIMLFEDESNGYFSPLFELLVKFNEKLLECVLWKALDRSWHETFFDFKSSDFKFRIFREHYKSRASNNVLGMNTSWRENQKIRILGEKQTICAKTLTIRVALVGCLHAWNSSIVRAKLLSFSSWKGSLSAGVSRFDEGVII
jgi:hypothetical protein